MQRRGGEWCFGGSFSYEYIYKFTYPFLRKLEGVIVKLEPLSDQNALVRFLRNVENAKTLGGFVQELANAITDYQVRAAGLAATFTECPARFRCNKGCTRGRERSMVIPRTS
jgi:hypothetical protein